MYNTIQVITRDVVAEFFREWQDEPSQTAVHVQTHVVACGDLAQLLDGVDGPLGIRGGGGVDEDGVGAKGFADRCHADRVSVWIHGHFDESHAQHVAALVNGRVGRRRGDHLWLGYAVLLAVVVAVGLYGENDTLRPSLELSIKLDKLLP
jgi:hypothetical protein